MQNARSILLHLCLPAVFLLQTSCTTPTATGPTRCSLWIDMYSGEPAAYEDVLEDLAKARVVYIGERHTLQRHHDVQARIVEDLIARDLPLVLALEQLEGFQQPILDEYNTGQIDFDELARKTDWAQRWSNYEQYRPIVEAAHQAGMPILALNAKAETVRQVARQGLANLAPELRAELPADINLDDPMYENHVRRLLMVHAMANKDMTRRMFQAQVARDETMAARLCNFLASHAHEPPTAVVLCGAVHAAHGMGIPSRVRRRMPHLNDRIIVLSESGDLELSAREKAMARAVTITHEDLRALNRPLADYLRVTTLRPASPELADNQN